MLSCTAGDLYERPPEVVMATAVQQCGHADWGEAERQWADHLTWLSVFNKLDYARLHGSTFHLTAVTVRVNQRSFSGFLPRGPSTSPVRRLCYSMSCSGCTGTATSQQKFLLVSCSSGPSAVPTPA